MEIDFEIIIDYMTETYVDPDQSLFPIELWNQYDIEGYN